MMLKIVLMLLFANAVVFGDEVSNLMDKYLFIINKYNNGDIYIDRTVSNQHIVDYFKENNPYKNGLPFSINEADLPTLRDQYLKLMERLINGVLDVYDPNKPRDPKMKDYAYSHVSREGFHTLRLLMEDVEANGIDGDFIETGVWRGGVTMFMKAFLYAYGNDKRNVWVCDSFEGWPQVKNDPDSQICNNKNLPWIVVSDTAVKNNFERVGLLDDKVIFLKGWFKDTLPTAPIKKIAILRLDGDLYESTKNGLESLYPKLEIGGYIIVDDYNCFSGCNRAVDEYRSKYNIIDKLYRQGPNCYGVYWQKTHD